MSNTLYEQLKAGTKAEDIAAAFAQQLNEAEERIRAEEAEAKRKEEEAALLKVKEETKRDDAIQLISDFIDFIAYYYPALGLDDAEITDEDIELLADLMIALLDIEALKPGKRSFKLKSYKAPEAKVEVENTETVPHPVRGLRAKSNPVDETADPFTAFFQAFGL